jgi:hypothetical protein
VLVDENDELHRLTSTKFDQMMQDPATQRMARFAGARVRTASILVELKNRKPTRVVCTTFSILTFDALPQAETKSAQAQIIGLTPPLSNQDAAHAQIHRCAPGNCGVSAINV